MIRLARGLVGEGAAKSLGTGSSPQREDLPACRVEILGPQPFFEGRLAIGPFGVEEREHECVAVATLDQEMLPQLSFQSKAEPQRSAM